MILSSAHKTSLVSKCALHTEVIFNLYSRPTSSFQLRQTLPFTFSSSKSYRSIHFITSLLLILRKFFILLIASVFLFNPGSVFPFLNSHVIMIILTLDLSFTRLYLSFCRSIICILYILSGLEYRDIIWIENPAIYRIHRRKAIILVLPTWVKHFVLQSSE